MANHCAYYRVIALLISLSFSGLLSAEVSGPFQLKSDFSGTDLPRVTGSASLTISGDNYWNRQFFQNGEYPEISGYDAQGNVLTDGLYTYELRSIPDSSLANDPAGAIVGGSEEPYVLKSGFFNVKSGQIVSP
jgi:hypothetical protein